MKSPKFSPLLLLAGVACATSAQTAMQSAFLPDEQPQATRIHLQMQEQPRPQVYQDVLVLAQAAQAQAQVQAEAAQAEARQAQAQAQVAAVEARVAALDMDGNLAFMRSEMGQERQVKGAPYCADAVHETVQPLADGNRIVRSQSTRLCRDGEGRSRQEVERNGQRSVFLNDPVLRQNWVLDVQAKTATQLGGGLVGVRAMPGMANVDSVEWREYGERMREWAQTVKERVRVHIGRDEVAPPSPPAPPAPPAPPVPPAPVVVTQSDSTTKDAQGRERREVRVEVLRADNKSTPMPSLGAMPVMPTLQAPVAVTLRAVNFAPRGPGVVTPLGSKEIEGLKVNGERTSWTIEAGKVGNEKPIVITRDVWTSPDLMITVATRDFDPRSGEVNYQLKNIKRAEPDAALMKVPADYAVAAPQRTVPTRVRTPKPAASAPTAKG